MNAVAIVLLAVLLFVGSPAGAVNLTCSVPNAVVTRAQELCEEIRLELHVRSSVWSNNECATQLLRLGLFEANRKSVTKAANLVAAQTISTELQEFDPLWPGLTPASCGDGTLDTEFGEQCDDNNQTPGDGCNGSCQTE